VEGLLFLFRGAGKEARVHHGFTWRMGCGWGSLYSSQKMDKQSIFQPIRLMMPSSSAPRAAVAAHCSPVRRRRRQCRPASACRRRYEKI
jgi:hypothetical protein